MMRARVRVLVLALALVGCGESARPYTVVVYSSLPEPVLEYVERAFQEAQDSIDLRFVSGDATGAADRLRKSPDQADVWWGSPTAVDSVTDWHTTAVSPFVIAFNREKVPLGRAPTDWIDLFHPRWRDEIVMVDPNVVPEMSHFITGHLAHSVAEDGRDLVDGFDWLLRLDAATGAYVVSVDEAVRRLRMGNGLMTILPRDAAEAARHDGAEWLYYRNPESGSPLTTVGAGVLPGAPEPELARALVAFLTGADVSRQIAALSWWTQPEGDPTELPPDHFLPGSWTGWPVDRALLRAESEGWLKRWNDEVRDRGKELF
jgi:iron(III) transport system substrate-binding protein